MDRTKKLPLIVTLVLTLLPAMLAAQTVEPIGTVVDDVAGVDGLGGPRYVAVSPDGSNVYVAAEGDSGVSVFERGHASGLLAFVEAELDGVNGVDGIGGANAIQISPDGRHVYVAGAFDRAVAVFKRLPSTGELEFVEAIFDDENGVSGLASPVWMTLSADGRDLYVSGTFAHSIVHFKRNALSGRLKFVRRYTDGEDGIENMMRPFGSRISNDGRNFYVAAQASSAVVIFSRRPGNGALTYQGALVNGIDGVQGLGGIRDLELNPSSRHLYTVSLQDGAIGIFKRRRGTGDLTFIDFIEGVPVAPSIISNGQRRVYTLSFVASALVVLGRDTVTGILGLGDLEFEGQGGVLGMMGPLHLAVSPNGRHLYVPGFAGNAMAIFETSR